MKPIKNPKRIWICPYHSRCNHHFEGIKELCGHHEHHLPEPCCRSSECGTFKNAQCREMEEE